MQAVLKDIIQETYDTRTLRFSPEKPLQFIAGQFVMAQLQIEHNGAMKPVKRAFSVSSSPLEKDFMDITVKVYTEGRMSPKLFSMKKGDTAEITGPYGKFVFDESSGRHFVFLAAGTGVAPIMSMIRYCIGNKLDKKLTLIFSNKTERDIICRKELDALEKENDNFTCIHTLTRESGSSWHGRKGRISTGIVNECCDTSEAVFYICGSPDMVKDMREMLEGVSVSPGRIHYEAW